MKRICRILLFAVLAGMAFSDSWAAAKVRLGGRNLSSYVIVYSAQAEPEEGIDAARMLQSQLSSAADVTLDIESDEQPRHGAAIVLEHDAALEPFGYRIRHEGARLHVTAGGSWSLRKAASLLAEALRARRSLPSGYRAEGTVEGEWLFPLTEGANLRILDDNIWDYSAETIPEAWQKLGVDPRDDVRAPQFAQLVRAYMPDIVTLQEYSRHMHKRFYPLIQKWGYVISYESGDDWDNTPIFYNPETIEQLYSNYVLYRPAQWSNAGSKSFTSAVFRHKSSGRVFAVMTTHLWYKSEKAQPGSTQARASQVRLMLAEAEMLKATYKCPIFVTGDMNCYEETLPLRQFLEEGYQPCYRLATVRTDDNNGHHICGPKDGFSRQSRRPSPNRHDGAIDHCLLLDKQKQVEVRAFDCVQDYFTIKLTDHYPNVIDAKFQ